MNRIGIIKELLRSKLESRLQNSHEIMFNLINLTKILISYFIYRIFEHKHIVVNYIYLRGSWKNY
ncbi:hypothetical protein BpHYR1_047549 [Brachionus plicatilis]|uniref:Uncharacterized protein n=1 Tax=Brachionus plicatilis TaxID=10195 RepID=A0A3M7P4Y4_BRAPC|nr:hypothetical protein BpHYR1_047549 [Brachionus plicatilis]